MKKKMKWFRMAAWTVLLPAVWLTGCVDLEYVGQTFPELPEDTEVAFFTPEIPVPEGEYHAIGRATVTAPGSTSNETLRDDLIESARDHGADAVQVVDFKRVKVGERSAVDGSTNPGPNAGWTQDARNAGGAYIYTNSFGETTELEKPKRAVYETTVKALFLVTNARFKTVTGDLKKEENAVARQVEKRLDAPVTADGLGAAIGQLPTPESPSADPAAAVTAPQKAPPTQVQLRNDPVTL